MTNDRVRALLDLPVTAALKDRSNGIGEREANLLLVDDSLAVAECLKPQKFFAKTVRAPRAERRAKAQRVARENARLDDFRKRVVPLIDQHLAKAESLGDSLEPQAARWERAKISELRDRLNKIRRRAWKIN